MGRFANLGRNLLLATGATLAFLVLGEAGLTALGLPRGGLGAGALGGRHIVEHLGGSLEPWQEEDPDLLWRLRPHQHAIKTSGRGPWWISTNSAGMRSPEPRASASHRVLCLGDSVTMGFGVDDEGAYPAVLEAALSQQFPAVQVVNAGVLGYTSEQGRVLAARLVPALRPDVVIVCFGINDNWPTVYPDQQLIGDMTFVRKLQKALGRSRIYATLRKQIVHAKLRRAAAGRKVGPRVIPERYAGNLESIIATVRSIGAEPILVAPTSRHGDHRQSKTVELHASMQVYREVMGAVAARAGVPFIDHPTLSGRTGESRWRFMDWCHPDADGLCMLAQEVAPVVREKLAPRSELRASR